MKKLVKKILTTLLIGMCIAGVTPISAMAAESDTGSGTKIYALKEEKGVYVCDVSDYDSNVLFTAYESVPLYCTGDVEEGYGSDGQIHDWYKVTVKSVRGWVRKDFLTSKDGKYYTMSKEGDLNLRAKSTYNSDLVATITHNTKVRLTGKSKQGVCKDGTKREWVQVKVATKITGWVRGDLTTEDADQNDQANNSDNAVSNANWQQLYYDFLMQYCTAGEYSKTFALVYVDEDDIPELVMDYNGTGRFDQVSLYMIYQESVCELGQVGTFSTLDYLERQNRIVQKEVYSGGQETIITVLAIENGQLVQVSDDVSEDQLKHTPFVTYEEGAAEYFCTEEDIAKVLSDPSQVTI